jgi:dihydrofolate reductase
MQRAEAHVFIAISLDGYIARPDGSLDWLMHAQASVPAGQDFGYERFMAGIDALVLGRKTFETVLGFEPWPYAGRPVYVMSRSAQLSIPQALQGEVQHTGLQPLALLQQLHAEGVLRVYLDGGELIQAFLQQDLVDSLTLTTVPLMLGQGRRLFGPLPADRRWTLQALRHEACSFAQAHYTRADEAQQRPPSTG